MSFQKDFDIFNISINPLISVSVSNLPEEELITRITLAKKSMRPCYRWEFIIEKKTYDDPIKKIKLHEF